MSLRFRFTANPLACLSLIAAGLLPSPIWADCPQDYTQAMSLLDNAQKSALAGNHPDADAFSGEFEAAVNRLSAGHCMPELVKLIDHIRTEQAKYGDTTSQPPAPFTD